MDFRGHVRVFNHSGEEYENAEVRLIVGKINLVEKIAELARRQGMPVPAPGDAAARRAAARRKRAASAFAAAGVGAADDRLRRQGPPRRSSRRACRSTSCSPSRARRRSATAGRSGWSAVRADEAGFEIVYRMRGHQYGPRPVRFFLWRNDARSTSSATRRCPTGACASSAENGQEGLSFLGEQLIRYVPIKAEIEINLGADDLVVYETRKAGTERFNFRFHGRHEVGRRLGRADELGRPDPQLPEEGDPLRAAAHLGGRRGLHVRAGDQALRLPDDRGHARGRRPQQARLSLPRRHPPGQEPEAEPDPAARLGPYAPAAPPPDRAGRPPAPARTASRVPGEPRLAPGSAPTCPARPRILGHPGPLSGGRSERLLKAKSPDCR